MQQLHYDDQKITYIKYSARNKVPLSCWGKGESHLAMAGMGWEEGQPARIPLKRAELETNTLGFEDDLRCFPESLCSLNLNFLSCNWRHRHKWWQ